MIGMVVKAGLFGRGNQKQGGKEKERVMELGK
jgi:hypothetical protein